MSGPVHTKWHKFLESYHSGNWALITSRKECVFWDEAPPDYVSKENLDAAINEATKLPRFIVDQKLVRMACSESSFSSLADMRDCEALQIPFSGLVTEFDNTDSTGKTTRYFVVLYEQPAEEQKNGHFPWAGWLFGFYDDGPGEGMAVVSPCAIEITLTTKQKAIEIATVNTDVEVLAQTNEAAPVFAYSATKAFYISGELAPFIAEDAYSPIFKFIAKAFVTMMIMPSAIGVSKEAGGVKEALNKARERSGKHRIPPYTIIRIHSFERSPGAKSERYVEGVSPEPFLRRAHKRRLAVGVGRTGRKWHLFPAQVVGYLPDGRKPEMSEMLATRALRPYVVK